MTGAGDVAASTRLVVLPNGNVLRALLRLRKLGNQAPYFSAQIEERTARGAWVSGGADHARLLDHWPDRRDFVALHLARMDGEPMHALENAWFHAGGTQWSSGHVPHLAAHLRVDDAEAERIIALVTTHAWTKPHLSDYVDGQRARWRREADAVIARYRLTIEEGD